MKTDVSTPPSPSHLSGLRIEIEREEDGRYLAEIPALPGVMVYGADEGEALARVKGLALRVLAERLERGEPTPEIAALFQAA
jgi:predicted RNase H-like HicB family nuclease